MIRDLPPTIGLDNRNVAGRKNVLCLAGLTLGKHRVVFRKPQLVSTVLRTGVCVGTHVSKHLLVVSASQLPDRHVTGRHQSTILTLGSLMRSRAQSRRFDLPVPR